MAERKRIPGVEPMTPLDEAAQIILDLRFEAVQKQLALAKNRASEDPEHVHQLRVAARRAEAAIREFSTCLGPKVAHRLRKSVKQIRRVAGRARDWDVFLSDIRGREGLAQAGAFVKGYAMGQREAAELSIARVKQFEPRWSIKAGGNRLLSELGASSIAARSKAFEEALQLDLDDGANLHRVRIEGKKLRYAMELFIGCYDEERHDILVEVQDSLGRANDDRWAHDEVSAMAKALSRVDPELFDQVKPGLESLCHAYRRQIETERAAFAGAIKKWRESG